MKTDIFFLDDELHWLSCINNRAVKRVQYVLPSPAGWLVQLLAETKEEIMLLPFAYHFLTSWMQNLPLYQLFLVGINRGIG